MRCGSCIDALKNYHKARNYNLAPGEYEALLIAQQGMCAICLKPPKQGRNLHVDHVDLPDGTCVVRGLLCVRCNTFIGTDAKAEKVNRAYMYVTAALFT